jgi:hypothetical protein
MRFWMKAWLALTFAATLPACAADLGTGGGATFPEKHALGIGRLAVSTRVFGPSTNSGWLIGLSTEARAEAHVGSRFSVGVSAGYGSGPDLIGSRLGWEAFADVGTPLRGGLFTEGGYAGATLQLPIRLSDDRPAQDINDSIWIVTRRFELVPFLRTRVHIEPHADESTEIVGGVSGRFRVFSDLL